MSAAIVPVASSNDASDLCRRLREIEQDPSGYDLLDFDKLLRDCGARRFRREDTLVYSLEGVLPITFRRGTRNVPAQHASNIARSLLNHFGCR